MSAVSTPPTLDPVLLTPERVREVLEDAVARGRLSPEAAGELLAELVGRGVDPDVPPEPVLPALPIPGYDELTAAAVTAQLAGLTPAQLRLVRDHERRNLNRKSVLAALTARLH